MFINLFKKIIDSAIDFYQVIFISNNNRLVFKILAIGDGGVGKTTFLTKAIEGNFLKETPMTIGVGFFSKEYSFNSKNIILQIWDCGGQDQFKTIRDIYTKGAKGAILMFDLTRVNSLDELDDWVSVCRNSNPEIPILFVGTKKDLDAEISIDDDLIFSYVDKYGFFNFIKISSKTGENIEYCFEILIEKILDNTLQH